MQMVRVTVLLPDAKIPPPCRWNTIAVVSHQSSGAMERYVTVQKSGKWFTVDASLPEMTHVVNVTVLVPVMYIPPPCKGEDKFSSFMTLHWGDGRR